MIFHTQSSSGTKVPVCVNGAEAGARLALTKPHDSPGPRQSCGEAECGRYIFRTRNAYIRLVGQVDS